MDDGRESAWTTQGFFNRLYAYLVQLRFRHSISGCISLFERHST